MRGSLTKWAVMVALAAMAPPAMAQQIPLLFKPATAPDQSHAIPLAKAPASAEPEQWETLHDELIVRNVVQPTLMPFLPPRGKATGAAVIVAPGGGFLILSMENEGYAVARWLAEHGVAAFVLKYRLEPTPRVIGAPGTTMGRMPTAPEGVTGPTAGLPTPRVALEDAQAAMRLVRERAKEWDVDPNRLGFVGFSAGAMTTLSVALSGDKATRPDFIAPIYGLMGPREVPADAPPMFAAVAMDDPLMAKGDVTGLVQSWHAAGRPVSAHFYEKGGHGFGMARKTESTALWIDEFYAWMADQGLLKPKP